MAGPNKQQHVAVLAFPFGCHAKPVLNLVSKLATALPQAHFSFFSTSKSNHALFFSSSQSDLPTNVKPYSVEDGVPAGGHPSVREKTPESLELFLAASPANFERAIDTAVTETSKSITCLITDGFLLFGAKMAEKLNVPWFPVWIPFPSSLSAHINTDLIRRSYINGDEDINGTLESIPGLSKMRIADVPDEVLNHGDSEETTFSRMLSQSGRLLPKANAIVVNFYEELNLPLLNQDLKSKFQNLLNVGFLTLPPPPSDSDPTGCLSWLDGQRAASVTYISFGTLATPSHEELAAMAEALEASGLPFLWSLRGNLEELLPDGFVERTKGIGNIVSWAPQGLVLGHGSVGVFVTHCGCNSVYESVANGVPMICRPFFGDHRMIGRTVEDVWGVGVGVEGGVFTKSGLLKSLEVIFGDHQGKEIKRNAQALKEVVLKAAEPNGIAARDLQILRNMIDI